PIDPVRYISNRSSGKMGYGLAAAALRRGAQVTLIAGPTQITPPPGAVFVPVQTAEEMREAVLQHLSSATIVIKAAAVADYRATHPAAAKIKGKRDLTLELTPNPDILAEVAGRRTGAFIVGFAAETHDVAANARAKLEGKGIDLPSSFARALAATSWVSAAKPTMNAPVRRPATSARMSGFGVSSSVRSRLPLIFAAAGCWAR